MSEGRVITKVSEEALDKMRDWARAALAKDGGAAVAAEMFAP